MSLRTIIAAVAAVVALALTLLTAAGPTAAQGAADSWPPAPVRAPADGCAGPLTGSNQTINVGPGHEHTELTTVPWLSLTAGDVVNIHHRAEPYRTKLGLRAQGTEERPVVINGVTDAQCRRPVITGADALTTDDAIAAQFFNKEWTEFLGTIFIYRGPDDPFGYIPSNITIQNLAITGASIEDAYTGQDGSRRNYGKGAAGVYAVVVDNLTLVNNEITGNGNGVFVNTKSVEETSRNIVVRHNRIYDNGTPGSYLEHNLYVQARRTLYEGNYFGQLVVGAEGSSLKDRSSGTVVRFNHIDAAARAIDLVEIEGGVGPVFEDPLYHTAWVYGNTIVTDHNTEANSSALLIHWGGDNDPRYFRTGTLHAYHNTIVIEATRDQRYWFALFDLPDDRQRVEAHGNTIVNRHDALLYLGRDYGTIELTGTNWITEGWLGGHGDAVDVIESGTVLTGPDPGLSPTFAPTADSPLIDRTTPEPITAPAPGVVDHLQVDSHFLDPSGLGVRPTNGSAPDLGAFEAGPSDPVPPNPVPPEPGVIAGQVAFADGTAVADVVVDLFEVGAAGERGAWLGDQRTGAAGAFRFELAAGCHVITIIAPEGRTFLPSGRWHQQQVCREPGQSGPAIEAVLAGGPDGLAAISGSVVDSAGGGVPDVAVDLFEAAGDGSRGRWLGDQRTDAAGRFAHPVSPGCYVATVIAPDGSTFTDGSRWYQAGRCVTAETPAEPVDATLS